MTQMCPTCGRDNRDTGRFCAYCQTQLQGLLGSHSVLQNRYEVQRLLGCGGMGAVYLALDRRLGQNPVAVKENFDASAQAQAQFQREANVLAKLSQVNLPKVIDHFIEPSGRQYLVMEYIAGDDLAAIIKQRGALPEVQVVTIAEALLDALTYLHTQTPPIVHRDIKPANIKLTPAGKVYLVDFGLVKLYDAGNPRTSTSMRGLGTPEYAPPEQYNPSSHTDPRSDIYALGATLYHLATGQAPVMAVMRMANPGALVPPRQLQPALSVPLGAAMMRALELSMGNRFGTAAQMRQAWRAPTPFMPTPSQQMPTASPSPMPAARQPQPVPRAPQPVPQPRPTVRKRRASIWPGLIAVMVLAAIAVVVLSRTVFAPTAPTPTVGPLSTTPGAPTPAAGSTAAPPAPTATNAAPLISTAGPIAPTPAPVDSPTPAPTLAPGSLSGLNISTVAGKTGLRVELRYADGSPKPGSYVAVYSQKTDVSGNPINGDQLNAARTDAGGQVFFDLGPGTYALAMGDLYGDKWGSPFNYTVSNGSTTVVSLTLGRLIIGVRDADGGPISNRYTEINLQKLDVSGNPIKGDQVTAGRTDNTGAVVYDLVPGTYVLGIGDISGEAWGETTNHQIPAGQTTRLILTLGRLTIGVKNADGQPVESRNVRIYFQKKDISGNLILGDNLLSGRTDNTGVVAWDITAGVYGVDIGDVFGDVWGEKLNHAVNSGQTTSIVLTLGRLTVGVKDAGGQPASGQRVVVYHQKKDVAGNIIKGDGIVSGYTDNTGAVTWDMTAGHYVVEVGEANRLLDVPVVSGQTTFTDGVTITTR